MTATTLKSLKPAALISQPTAIALPVTSQIRQNIQDKSPSSPRRICATSYQTESVMSSSVRSLSQPTAPWPPMCSSPRCRLAGVAGCHRVNQQFERGGDIGTMRCSVKTGLCRWCCRQQLPDHKVFPTGPCHRIAETSSKRLERTVSISTNCLPGSICINPVTFKSCVVAAFVGCSSSQIHDFVEQFVTGKSKKSIDSFAVIIAPICANACDLR